MALFSFFDFVPFVDLYTYVSLLNWGYKSSVSRNVCCHVLTRFRRDQKALINETIKCFREIFHNVFILWITTLKSYMHSSKSIKLMHLNEHNVSILYKVFSKLLPPKLSFHRSCLGREKTDHIESPTHKRTSTTVETILFVSIVALLRTHINRASVDRLWGKEMTFMEIKQSCISFSLWYRVVTSFLSRWSYLPVQD